MAARFRAKAPTGMSTVSGGVTIRTATDPKCHYEKDASTAVIVFKKRKRGEDDQKQKNEKYI